MRRAARAGCAACLGVVLLAGAATAGPASWTCTPVELWNDDSGRKVVGAEDIVVDAAASRAYVSAYDRRAVERDEAAAHQRNSEGGVYALELAAIASSRPIPERLRVTELTAGYRSSNDLLPHGIGLHIGPAGERRLFVVNHAETRQGGASEAQQSVEVFDLEGGALRHRTSVSRPGLCQPNAVAPLDARRFFVTNDHGRCSSLGMWMEDILNRRESSVYFYDGEELRKVADRIGYANGIHVRPDGVEGSGENGAAQAGQVYVAATREDRLRVYPLLELARAAAPIGPTETIPLESGPDNISPIPGGGLLVGVIPDTLRYAAFRFGWFGVDRAASRIVMVTPGIGQETVLEDSTGETISGATVAARYRELMLLGAAYDERIAICRVGSGQTAGGGE